MLGYDVYTKKLLIEKLLDGFGDYNRASDSKGSAKDKSKDKQSKR